jgi:hypothetical protein
MLDGRYVPAIAAALSVKWRKTVDAPTPNKLTCRYTIPIPTDKEFAVARRIIGNKGRNMKGIIYACSEQLGFARDVVKLRLRGKGSGYKEGP